MIIRRYSSYIYLWLYKIEADFNPVRLTGLSTNSGGANQSVFFWSDLILFLQNNPPEIIMLVIGEAAKKNIQAAKTQRYSRENGWNRRNLISICKISSKQRDCPYQESLINSMIGPN